MNNSPTILDLTKIHNVWIMLRTASNETLKTLFNFHGPRMHKHMDETHQPQLRDPVYDAIAKLTAPYGFEPPVDPKAEFCRVSENYESLFKLATQMFINTCPRSMWGGRDAKGIMYFGPTTVQTYFERPQMAGQQSAESTAKALELLESIGMSVDVPDKKNEFKAYAKREDVQKFVYAELKNIMQPKEIAELTERTVTEGIQLNHSTMIDPEKRDRYTGEMREVAALPDSALETLNNQFVTTERFDGIAALGNSLAFALVKGVGLQTAQMLNSGSSYYACKDYPNLYKNETQVQTARATEIFFLTQDLQYLHDIGCTAEEQHDRNFYNKTSEGQQIAKQFYTNFLANQ